MTSQLNALRLHSRISAAALAMQFTRGSGDIDYFYRLVSKFIAKYLEDPSEVISLVRGMFSVIEPRTSPSGTERKTSDLFTLKLLTDIEKLPGETGSVIQNAVLYALSFAKMNEIKAMRHATNVEFEPKKTKKAYIDFMNIEHPAAVEIAKSCTSGLVFGGKNNVISMMGYLLEQATSSTALPSDKPSSQHGDHRPWLPLP